MRVAALQLTGLVLLGCGIFMQGYDLPVSGIGVIFIAAGVALMCYNGDKR